MDHPARGMIAPRRLRGISIYPSISAHVDRGHLCLKSNSALESSIVIWIMFKYRIRAVFPEFVIGDIMKWLRKNTMRALRMTRTELLGRPARVINRAIKKAARPRSQMATLRAAISSATNDDLQNYERTSVPEVAHAAHPALQIGIALREDLEALIPPDPDFELPDLDLLF